MSGCVLTLSEDCTDCFGAQKKDEPNDKEKKEEEETSTSVHHSIIETWDWGRQPGENATWTRLGCILLWPTTLLLSWLLLFYAFRFPSTLINTMLTAAGFTTLKCGADTVILTFGHTASLSVYQFHVCQAGCCCMFSWHTWGVETLKWQLAVCRSERLFLPPECNLGRRYNVGPAQRRVSHPSYVYWPDWVWQCCGGGR